jgi:hypothetical protein
MSIPATDRRTDRRPAPGPAPHHAARHNDGKARNGHRRQRPPYPGNTNGHNRPAHGHGNNRPARQGNSPDRPQSQPEAIGTVAFMRRDAEQHRPKSQGDGTRGPR